VTTWAGLAGVALVAIAGASLLAWATARGPGLSPDSLKYVLLSRSLSFGSGFYLLGQASSHFWTGSPTLARARLTDAPLPYTNAPELLAFHAAGPVRGRRAPASAWCGSTG
jgi:hypothetical protein